MTIKASEKIREYIKNKERFESSPYKDANTGKMAVGYGDTDGDASKPISKEEAEARFNNRIKLAEDELSASVRMNLTQAQQDVMVDKHYNLGLDNMKSFISTVNSGDFTKARKDILKYNKSKNVKTGQMEVLPGLIERTKERASMWDELPVQDTQVQGRSAPEVGIPSSNLTAEFKANADILSLVEEYEDSQGQVSPEINELLNEFEADNVPASPVGNRLNSLSLASEFANSETALRNNEAKRLSKTLAIPLEEAEARLSEKSTKQILADQGQAIIAEKFSGVATWAQNPDNYVMLQETGDWPKKMELQSRFIKNDTTVQWGKVLKNNKTMVQESLLHWGMLMGQIDIESGAEIGADLDYQRQVGQRTDPGSEDIAKAHEDFMSGKIDAWGYILRMGSSPEATAAQGFESFSSTIAAIGAGVVAAPLTSPLGGLVAGASAAALLEFGGYMQEQLQDFRDPVTGQIDYKKAFSDQKKMTEWRKEAGIYSGVMGAGSASYSLIFGKVGPAVAKHIFKGGAKTTAGKISQKATVVGVEGLVGAVEEGASEVTAISSVDIYKGDLTPEKFKQNLKEGIVEGVSSFIPGAAVGSIGAGTRRVLRSQKNSADKTAFMVKESNVANEGVAALSELRATKEQEEASRTNPEQTQELIDASLMPPPITEDMFAPPVADVESLAKGESKQMDIDAEQGMVNVSPSEWDAYHQTMGLNPNESFMRLAPQIQQEFARNRGSDISVSMPTSEWLKVTEGDPTIDGIARIEGNSLNALEANEVAEGFESDPFTLFNKADIPPIPSDIVTEPSQDIEVIEVTDEEAGAIPMRPIELTGKFKTDAEKKVYGSIAARLKRISKDTAVAPESLDIVAELQFNHLRNRSNVLGVPVEDLSSRIKLGKTQKEGAFGTFQPNLAPNDPYTIALNKKADVATLLHEFGHSWLHELSEDYNQIMSIPEDQLTDAQTEYKKSMELAEELLDLKGKGFENLGQLNSKIGSPEYRLIQETFAQTTESYFLEGKFENNKVKQVMESLRQWMKAVMDKVLRVRSYPTLELSPEVERMMEGIIGVSDRVESEVIPFFPIPLFEPSMLGKEGAKYMEAIQGARSESVGGAYSKFFNKGLRAREKEIKSEMARITAEATETVDQRPSMVMLKNFEQSDTRFSFESVMRVLGNNDEAMTLQIKEAVPTAIMFGKKKGGIDVAQFMMMNDMSNVDDMRNILLETGQRDALIQKEINERVNKEFPIMKTDEELHEIAVAEVNNIGRERLILAEMKILADKNLAALKGMAEKAIQPPTYIARAVREVLQEQGTKLIREAGVRKFNAAKYLRDSHRHGRQAARHFRAGNLVESFNAKEREAISYFAYKAARGAQNDLAVTRARIKQFLTYSRTKDRMKTYDADVMVYGAKAIMAINNEQLPAVFGISTFSDQSGVTAQMVDSVNMARQNFIEQSYGRQGNNMSVQGAVAMGEYVRQIMNVARNAKKIEIEGNVLELAEVSREIGDEIMSNAEAQKDKEGNEFVRSVSFEQGRLIGFRNMRRSFVDVRTLLDSLYKSSLDFANSKLGEIYTNVTNAEATRNIEYSKFRKRIADAVKYAVRDDSKMRDLLAPLIGDNPGAVSTDRTNKPVMSSGEFSVDVNFKNHAEVWMAFLLMGSESGAKKFLLGGMGKGALAGINPETGKIDLTGWKKFRDRMYAEGVVTDKHLQMFKVIFDVMAEIHPLVKTAMRKSDGFLMGNIEGWGDAYDGQIEGGYFPIAPMKEIMSMGAITDALNADTLGYQASKMYPVQNTGMTNERSSNYDAIDLNMGNLFAYLGAAMNIAYIRNPMLDFGRVLTSPDVSSALEARRPGAAQSVILPWIKAVSNQTYTVYSNEMGMGMARVLKQRTNMAMYLGGYMTWVRQYVGLVPAMTKVSPQRLLMSSALISSEMVMALPFKGQSSKRAQFMIDNSVYIRSIMEKGHKDMIRSWDVLEKDFGWVNWTQEKVDTATYIVSQIAQNHVNAIVWDAAYHKATSKGLTHPASVRFADDAVKATQSTPAVSGLVNVQRGDEFRKLITMVSSIPIAMGNLVHAEVMRDQSKLSAAKALMIFGMIATIMPVIMDDILTDAIQPKRDDDDEDKTQEEKDQEALNMLGLRALSGVLESGFPIWSRVVTGPIAFGTEGSLSPALAMLGSLGRAKRATELKLNDVDLTASETTALMNVLTLTTGIPLSVIGKYYKLEEGLASREELEQRSDLRKEQLEDMKEE